MVSGFAVASGTGEGQQEHRHAGVDVGQGPGGGQGALPQGGHRHFGRDHRQSEQGRLWRRSDISVVWMGTSIKDVHDSTWRELAKKAELEVHCTG